jgi:integrase
MAEGSTKRHVAKDGTVTWRWRLAIVDPLTRKRRWSQWTFRTRRELDHFKRQKLAEVAAGQGVPRTQKTVGDVLTDWLTLEAPHSGIRQTSVENYSVAIRCQLLPALGAIPVQQLTLEAIERHYASLLQQGYARSTVVLAHVCLRQALERALRHKLVPVNVAAARMRVLSARNVQAKAARAMQTWTREECAAFLEAVPYSKFGPLWAILLGTGMRRGEGLGLRWCDLVLPREPHMPGSARVAQAIAPLIAAPPIVLPPKNGKTRLIPLVPALVSALRDHQDTTRGEASDEALVFCRPDGSPYHPDSADRDFRRVVELAEVPRIPLHCLRHTFATLSLEAGVPVHVVSRWLGHSDVATTLRVYAHVTAPLEERGTETLIGLFSPLPEASAEQSEHLLCASCPLRPS